MSGLQVRLGDFCSGTAAGRLSRLQLSALTEEKEQEDRSLLSRRSKPADNEEIVCSEAERGDFGERSSSGVKYQRVTYF